MRLEVTTDSTEAYTFRIKVPTDKTSAFENFVIEKIGNDYRYWLYKYVKLYGDDIIHADFPYSVFRRPVGEQEINHNDFKPFLKWLYYDDASGCLNNFPESAGIYDYADYLIWCSPGDSNSQTLDDSGSGGGTTDTGSLNDPTSNPLPPTNPNDPGSGDNTSGSGTGGNTSPTTNDNNDVASGDPNSPTGILPEEDDNTCAPGYVKDSNGNCVPEEIVVDPSLEQDYPCQSDIINNSFNRAAPLSKLVLDIFDNKDNNYNLSFFMDPNLDVGAAGGTYPISVNADDNFDKLYIRTGLSDALLRNGTDLAIVTTVIHESLHAIFIYMLETGKLTAENSKGDFDLRIMVRAYLTMRIQMDNFGTADQTFVDSKMHEYMTNFVEDIATVVSAYGNSKGYSLPFSYYKDLSWLGLVDNLKNILTDDRDRYTLEDEAEVNRIRAIIINEFQNKENAKGEKCVNQ